MYPETGRLSSASAQNGCSRLETPQLSGVLAFDHQRDSRKKINKNPHTCQCCFIINSSRRTASGRNIVIRGPTVGRTELFCNGGVKGSRAPLAFASKLTSEHLRGVESKRCGYESHQRDRLQFQQPHWFTHTNEL